MIEKKLKNKTAKQKAQLKSKELAKVKLSKFKKDKLDIEIIGDIKEIEVNGSHGIELFATAHKKGKQVGFGKDGTVEIERFRFWNSPVLVDDPNGDIIRKGKFDKITKKIKPDRKLKYDPTKAIKESLAHTISLVAKDGKDIVKGKVGNTTSTFYPDASPGSDTLDGVATNSDNSPVCSSSFSDAHNCVVNTSTDFCDDTDVDDWAVSIYKQPDTNKYWFSRGLFYFKTGTISSLDTIDSATFSLYITNTGDDYNDGKDYVSVVQVQGDNINSDTALRSDDYKYVGDSITNPTEAHDSGDRVDITDITTGQYTGWSFNSTGKGWIAKNGEASPSGATNGITYLGTREGHDIENSDPSMSVSTSNGIFCYMADETGTSQDPKLVVGHTSPVTAPTVTTQAVSDIQKTQVTGNGNITDTGGENCTTRGFCYLQGTTGDPTTADSTAFDTGSFGTGAYTKSITGLTQGTSYRVRAYAINSADTSYGTTVDVKTKAYIPKITMS